MMKTKVVILYLSILAVVSIAGCDSRHSYDARLRTADSLLRVNNPDSALQVLSVMDSAGLRSASDRAYHALLLTQAQYRSYADISSDSTINVALDYYKRHDGEQEKLTRSYIYKGAVTEVLGNPESAMTYYKQACSTAAPDDHFNLGYAKMRIGCLYRDYLVMDSADILNLKQALHHFEQMPDSVYILTCLSTIGGSYVARDKRDSATLYLEQADRLARALHQTAWEQTTLIYLADMKMFSQDIEDVVAAKDIAVSLLNEDQSPQDRRDHLLLIATYTQARLNKRDQASDYLKRVEKGELSDGLRVLYNRCLAELARCQGDISHYQYHFERACQIGDSLCDNGIQRQLRDAEAKYDNEVLKNKSLRYRTNWIISLMGTLLVAGALGMVILAMRRRLQRRRQQLRESEDTIERLRNDTIQLSLQLNENHAMSDSLKETISQQIETFTKLVEIHYTQFTHFPKKFGELFRKAYSVNQPDDSFWSGIRAYADSTHNGIITHFIEKDPSLSESDVRFLSLCCCELPITVVMACMGYNDVHSVYNKKRRLAESIGLTDKLDDYIADARS